MKDIDYRDYTAHFYFCSDELNGYIHLEVNGLRDVSKISIEEDNKMAMGLINGINSKVGVELSDIRRVSRQEYIENTVDEDDFEEEEI
ncbi:hypothetical protein [Peptoanaerobacter stomatis]|jgi:hypothetical protein